MHTDTLTHSHTHLTYMLTQIHTHSHTSLSVVIKRASSSCLSCPGLNHFDKVLPLWYVPSISQALARLQLPSRILVAFAGRADCCFALDYITGLAAFSFERTFGSGQQHIKSDSPCRTGYWTREKTCRHNSAAVPWDPLPYGSAHVVPSVLKSACLPYRKMVSINAPLRSLYCTIQSVHSWLLQSDSLHMCRSIEKWALSQYSMDACKNKSQSSISA